MNRRLITRVIRPDAGESRLLTWPVTTRGRIRGMAQDDEGKPWYAPGHANSHSGSVCTPRPRERHGAAGCRGRIPVPGGDSADPPVPEPQTAGPFANRRHFTRPQDASPAASSPLGAVGAARPRRPRAHARGAATVSRYRETKHVAYDRPDASVVVPPRRSSAPRGSTASPL